MIRFLVLMLICGCASTKAIDKNYINLVNIADGITAQEAKIMAQKNLNGMHERRDYRLTAPDIRTTPEALKFDDIWFVTFGHNWLSPVSKDAAAKTYIELKEAVYLVAIDKATGEILFSGEWYPKRDKSFDWVLMPFAYKENNPLALCPYAPGHPIPDLPHPGGEGG